MSEWILSDKVQRHVQRILWVGSVILLLGVEFECALLFKRARVLHYQIGPHINGYFLPLFLALPFLLGVQTYLKARNASRDSRNDLTRIRLGLVMIVVWAYAGFIALLSFLDAILPPMH
jgi:hypothetical protein